MQYGLLRKGKRVATSQNLEGMKLIELKELAKQMGLRGTSTMRKPELVATLQAARSGGEAPAGVTVRPVKGAASKPTQQTQPAAQAAQTPEQAPKAEPKGSAPVSAADDAVAGLVASLPEPDAASTRTPRISRQKAAESDSKDDRAAAPRRRTRDDAKAGQVAADLFDELDIAPADDQPRHRDDAADSGMMRRRRRAIEPRERDQQNDTVRDLDDILATLPVQNANYAMLPLARQEFVAVYGQGVPPPEARSIGVEELREAPLMLSRRRDGGGGYDLIMRAFQDKGVRPNVVLDSQDTRLLHKLLRQGMSAVAILPEREVAAGTLESFPMRRLDVPGLDLAPVLIWLEHAYLSRTARRVIQCLHKVNADPGEQPDFER